CSNKRAILDARFRLGCVLRVVDPPRTDRASAVVRSRRGEGDMTTGTIKKVVSDRGFGFIAAEDGKEYFFHRDGLTSSLDFDRLMGGEKVQFDIEQSPKGARAKNVQSA